jgi:integrase
MIPMVLYTGIRRGELLGLCWEDIDFRAGRIDVRRSYDGPTKTDQTRVIPLHRELAPILQAWREQCPKTPEGLVFPLVVRGVARMATRSPEITTKELRAQLARAGVRDGFVCPVHAMRHTFASLFMDQVDSQRALESILGHSTAGNKVTAGYVHTDIKTLARKLDLMTLLPKPDAQIIPLRATA